MISYVIILKDHLQSEHYGKEALSTGLNLGWNLKRFDAIDGRKTSFNDFNIQPAKASNKKCKNALTRPGVVGCFLSHYILWKLCVEKNKTIGIFEQDIIFAKSFENDVEFIDVLRFDRPKYDGKEYGTGTWWEGSHAYLITPQGANKLINWTHTVGAFPSDVALGTKVVDIQFNLKGLTRLNMESRQHSLTIPKTF